ncbi:MAG: amidohydrolase family protein [Synergistaceae bacterium]|nr:amidohydrolase family protein [Synergistaceae bacterium]
MSRVIDIHTHTFPDKIASRALESLSSKSHTKYFTDGTIKALKESMTAAGVDYSVILPVATRLEQVEKINNSAIEINSRERNLISFGAMHPDYENYSRELERIYKSGIKGIKIHPVYQGVNINDERYIRILTQAAELGLIVLIHAGRDIGFPDSECAMPVKILDALKKSDSGRIILAHMGGWRCWDEVCNLFAGRENIYIDTAFSLGAFIPNDDSYYKSHDECKMLSSQEFTRIIRTFGAERVLFGTDSPWSSQLDSVKEFESLELTDSEKELILFGNAARLLCIQ